MSRREKPKIPFGTVKLISFNAKKDMVALYSDAETKGRIIVIKSNMALILDDKDTL